MREKPLLQKHPIVMLPTNGASNIFLRPDDKLFGFPDKESTRQNSSGVSINQHLYVLNNEEIKEGDLVHYEGTITTVRSRGTVSHTVFIRTEYEPVEVYKSFCKKVIATTNPALYPKNLQDIVNGPIGKLPTDFIQAFIKQYNAGTPIEEILVEYVVPDRGVSLETIAEVYAVGLRNEPNYNYNRLFEERMIELQQEYKTLKLRPDGSIIIHPVKERVFTRADMDKAYEFGFRNGIVYDMPEHTNSYGAWMDENYPD